MLAITSVIRDEEPIIDLRDWTIEPGSLYLYFVPNRTRKSQLT
jgi:hypothetical protein